MVEGDEEVWVLGMDVLTSFTVVLEVVELVFKTYVDIHLIRLILKLVCLKSMYIHSLIMFWCEWMEGWMMMTL